MIGISSKRRIRTPGILVGAAILAASCASGLDRVAPARTSEAPTQKAITTATARPTATVAPTETPTVMPTETPLPLGAEVPIRGVTLKFTDAKVWNIPVNVGPKTFKPPEAGTSVLVVTAKYTGNQQVLFGDPYKPNGVLYVDDGTGVKKGWSTVAEKNTEPKNIQIIFYIKTGSTSLILHSELDTVWSMELSSRIPPPTPSP